MPELGWRYGYPAVLIGMAAIGVVMALHFGGVDTSERNSGALGNYCVTHWGSGPPLQQPPRVENPGLLNSRGSLRSSAFGLRYLHRRFVQAALSFPFFSPDGPAGVGGMKGRLLGEGGRKHRSR